MKKNLNDETDVMNIFHIDDDDIKILEIFQHKPDISHVEVSKRINKSQPTIGARVTKLERKHILETQKGTNFKKVNQKLFLFFVDLETRDPVPLLDEIKHCPFIINALKKSGKKNLTLILAATSMKKLEMIVDRHFRAHPQVISVETSFVVDMVRDFILPVNWEFLKYEDIPCGEICCQNVKQNLKARGKNDGLDAIISALKEK
ncbi:MAG: Lrp/AsnC family transcriptional regulator [Promethearchaeota archaeon]